MTIAYRYMSTNARKSPLIAAIKAMSVVLALAATSWVSAGQFSISPVRIFVTPKDRTTAVTVTNESDTELVMQADAFLWRQNATGQDELTLTEDVVVAPPIVKLAPRARQVIRLALLKPAPSGQQLTYRLIVREIPEARPPEPGVQLQIALAFSLPVFITQPGTASQLVCGLKRSAPNAVQADCENSGTAYAQVTDFKVVTPIGTVLASSNTAAYVLPGIKRSFELKSAGSSMAGGRVQLQITRDDQSVQTFEALLAD